MIPSRKTKIIATLGPASSSPELVLQLMNAGVDLFRLNFSHGTNENKRETIELIRRLSGSFPKQIGILADLQGPKIRTGRMENGAIPLARGSELEITTEDLLGTSGLISTIYQALPRDVRAGSRILLDDGLIELKVLSTSGNRVRCLVVEGGILKDLKGINLPGVDVSSPSLTDKDRIDLDFCMEVGVDMIALSFVRKSQDLDDIKRLIFERGLNIPVVAKIEKPEALRNFKAILKAADAIMVARGDLGVEIAAEKVPLIQKKIIASCNQAGKPVITATQMLESMINHPRPTRAETSDVANAILDGTDAVMLSGETASGQFPVEAVSTMAKIALDVERSDSKRQTTRMENETGSISEAVAEAACKAAMALNARAIVVFTQSGSTARLISKYRPPLPIIAFTPFKDIQRRLALSWGVYACPIGSVADTDQQMAIVEEALLSIGYRRGDVIVLTMGVPVEARGTTNQMKIHKLGTGQFYEIY